MRVWVLVRGVYSESHVDGVYATAEDAMRLLPASGVWTQHGNPPKEDETWYNDLDWDDSLYLECFQVRGLSPAVEALMQVKS